MNIRPAFFSDVSAIFTLFEQTVLKATVRDYSLRQRQAWARRGSDTTRWKERMATQHFLVAEQQRQLIGFGSITSEGYLDVLYVHYAHQNEGIASQLLTVLETWVNQQKVAEITTNASITARPFFERKGYYTLKEQHNIIEDIVLVNYRMAKTL